MIVAGTAAALRPRSGPEILDAAVPLLRRAYAACVVVWLAFLMIYEPVRSTYVAAWPMWAQYTVGYVTPVFPAAVLELLLADAYLGRPIRLDLAIVTVGRRSGALLAAHVQRMLLIGLGLFCLVVPGIIFWGQTFAAVPVVVLEACPASGAIDRSRRLTRDHMQRTILTLGVVLIISVAVQASIRALHSTATAHHLLNRAAREGIAIALSALFAPLVPAVIVVLYYDLRIRKEGLDLELMASSLTPA